MDSNLLKIFTTVAKCNSITKGAKKLKVTQANVTLRLQQLEKQLGFKLFHRVPKGVVLTKEGKKLLPLADEIDKKFEKIQLRIGNIISQDSLIIAATYSNASRRLIPFLKKLRTDYPDLHIKLITDNKVLIVDLLLYYKIDIGFVNHIPQHEDIMILKKFKNELLFLEPLDCTKDNTTVLAYDDDCAFYSGIKEYYKKLGIEEYEVIQIADYEVILASIQLGMGKSIIPKAIVEKLGYMDKVSCTLIDDAILEIPTCLICRRDNIPQIQSYLQSIDIS